MPSLASYVDTPRKYRLSHIGDTEEYVNFRNYNFDTDKTFDFDKAFVHDKVGCLEVFHVFSFDLK